MINKPSPYQAKCICQCVFIIIIGFHFIAYINKLVNIIASKMVTLNITPTENIILASQNWLEIQ